MKRYWLRITPRAVMIAGFGVMVMLMAQLVLVGLARLDGVAEQLDSIAFQQRGRVELTSQLLELSRERSELVYQIFALKTVDSQGRMAQRCQWLGTRIRDLTHRLQAMPPDLRQQGALHQALSGGLEGLEMQDRAVASLIAGDVRGAARLHAAEAIPRVSRFEDQLASLLEHQRAGILQTIGSANADTQHAYLLLGTLGGSLVVIGLLVAMLVIRHMDRAEAALFREKERAEVTLHSIAEGVIATDAGGNVEMLNAVAEALTGWRTEDARGLPLGSVYVLLDEKTQQPVEYGPESAAGSERNAGVRPGVLQAKDGRRIPVEESVAPIRSASGKVAGSVVVFHDISHIRAMAQRLTWQASHDALTGLVNRREFERQLTDLLQTARADGQRHALLYLDLDRFKAINDSCGHIAGDELLRQLAALMHVKIRGSDTLARIGGDEFGVLLEACPADHAIRIANGLREIVRDFRFPWKDREFTVGVSIGLVLLDTDSGGVAEVLDAADASCYAAKNKGGSRVELYRPEQSTPHPGRGDLAIVHQISAALEQGGFRLYRQPIVAVAAGSGKSHYEILVRMVDEAGELMQPTDFIPSAERFNLLPMLDRWVVGALLDFIVSEEREGAAAAANCYSVNLSGTSINDSTFTDFLRRQIELHHVPARRLCFEVTETTAISNLTKAGEFMHELRALGCRFALDDFGVGMSSFAYLKHLPVDFLKIDGSFVRDLASSPVDYAIVDAINRIAHLLGIQTIAEFVTDPETLDKLRQLKVDYAQGDAIGIPEPLVLPVPAASAVAV